MPGKQPDVVGISLRNIDNNDMQHPEFYPAELLPIMKLIREWRQVPIVLGGAGGLGHAGGASSFQPGHLRGYRGLARSRGGSKYVFRDEKGRLLTPDHVRN